MDIRPMTMQDYDAVYALWLRTPGMGLNDVDDSPAGVERYLHRNPDTCLVAEADGKIVGVVLGGEDGRRGFLYHLAVDAAYRRQGIATQLVQRATEILRARGLIKVALLAFAHNHTGNTFWDEQHFAAREDVVYHEKVLRTVHRIDT